MGLKFNFKVITPTRVRAGQFDTPHLHLDLKWKQGRLNKYAMRMMGGYRVSRITIMWDSENRAVAMITGGDNLPKSRKLSIPKGHLNPVGQFTITNLLEAAPEIAKIIKNLGGKAWFHVVKTDFEQRDEFEGEKVFVAFLQQ